MHKFTAPIVQLQIGLMVSRRPSSNVTQNDELLAAVIPITFHTICKDGIVHPSEQSTRSIFFARAEVERNSLPSCKKQYSRVLFYNHCCLFQTKLNATCQARNFILAEYCGDNYYKFSNLKNK